jgi:hypothetical protein
VRAPRETPDASAGAEGASSPAQDREPRVPVAAAPATRAWSPPGPGGEPDGDRDDRHDGRGDRDRGGASLDGSLQLPASSGSRAAVIGLVLLVDAALVVAGVLLWRGARPAAPGGDDSGAIAVLDAGPGDGPAVAIADATAGGAAPAPAPIAGGGRPASAPGTGGSSGSTPGPDARSLDDLLGRRDAAVGPASPAGQAGQLVDAALEPAPPVAADAAPEPPEPPDAAGGPLDPYGEPAAPVDAGADGEPEAEAGAVDAADAIARLTSRNQQRFQRCYRQAAKAYTPEQPLEGEVDIALRVMPTGEVREVSTARNTTGSDTLAQCLVSVIAGWRVAAGSAEPIDMVRPFRFGSRP